MDATQENRAGSIGGGGSPPPIVRLAVLGSVLLAAGVGAIRSAPAVDLWWQLATGRLIIETHRIPHTDPFSFTAAGAPIVVHEWLSCVGMYAMSQAWGVASIGLAKCILAVAITALVFRAVLLRSRSWPLAGAVALFGFVSMRAYLGPRPLMLTLVFAALLLNLGAGTSDGRRPWRLGLPILFLLWANCHLGFMFGLVLLAVIAVDECIAHRARVWSWVGIWLACALATLVNPYGYHVHETAIQILTDPAAMNSVAEWLSPDFHQQYNLPFLLLLLVSVGLAARTWRTCPALTVLMLLLGACSLRAMRNMTLFSLVAPVAMAEALAGVFNRRYQTVLSSIVVASAAVALVLHLGALTHTNIDEAAIGTSYFPTQAVEYLRGQEGLRNIYDEYKWGGYCIYELYPQYRVFIDGRAEVYFDEPLRDYFEIHYVRPGWRAALGRYDVDAALVDRQGTLYQVLSTDPGWRVAYGDDLAVVFVRSK